MELNKCPAGFLCPISVSDDLNGQDPTTFVPAVASQCSAGNYCLEAALIEIPCPPGRYRATVGAASETECPKVDAGYYTDAEGQTSFTANECAKGYYCEEGSNSA
jgi:hypothetical protein